ncbi:MAG: OmpP1/FadL family transporter [Legionellales bacterium]
MRLLPTGILCLLAFNSQANVIQYFAGISYNNPSELFKVKDSELLFGGTGSFANLKFTGSVLNFNTFQYGSGVDHSKTFTLMPYGRIAKRINKKTVFAVDVTEPFNSNLNWGNNAFTRYANTQNLLTDIDISPKLAFSISQKIQIGGGINLNFLENNEVNWAYPTGPTTYANLTNVTSGFGVGYNMGITYILNQTNFLGLTYYSRIRQGTKGVSSLGNLVNNSLFFNFSMPATTVASYVHIFNPKWLVSLQGFQSEWNVNQYVRLFNTAVPAPNQNFSFSMLFKKSYVGLAAVRHQYNEQLGLTLAGMVDVGPEQNDLRSITFPSYVQYFIGLVGDYHFNPHTSIELLYGHVFSNPPINNTVTLPTGTIPFATGKVDINVNVLDLKLKIEA